METRKSRLLPPLMQNVFKQESTMAYFFKANWIPQGRFKRSSNNVQVMEQRSRKILLFL